MERTRLVLGLSAVFAGLTALLAVTAIVYQPFLLLVTLPFGATAWLLWYHATGRLQARLATDTRRGTRNQHQRTGRRSTGFGAGPRQTGGSGAWQRRAQQQYERRQAWAGDAGASQQSAGRGGPQPNPGGFSRREAYDILGLSPDASAEDIKQAYRARVKKTHPDTESGDEEQFKRVTRAYETLTN